MPSLSTRKASTTKLPFLLPAILSKMPSYATVIALPLAFVVALLVLILISLTALTLVAFALRISLLCLSIARLDFFLSISLK